MRSSGLVFGLIIGLAIAAILIKAANKDGKFKTKYDERQEAVRGKAYKYSFYTLLFFDVLRIIPESGNLLTGSSSCRMSPFTGSVTPLRRCSTLQETLISQIYPLH